MNNLSAFDAYAETYDSSFTHSAIGQLQRKRVWKYLDKYLPEINNSKLLEINCGTGEDAIRLASRKYSIIATDASERMISVCWSKAPIPTAIGAKSNVLIDAEKVGERTTYPEFIQCSFSELASKFNGQQFDFVLSNFGGLNCIDKNELSQLSDTLSSLLKPAGKLFLVVMGRKCLWEKFYFLLKKDLKKAGRRMSKSGVETTVSGKIFLSYYYSPYEFKNLFCKNFNTEKIKPIGIMLPPSYLEPFFFNKKWLLKILNWKESVLGKFSFLADFADHYVIILEKKNQTN